MSINEDIKQKVLGNKLLQHVLEQIENPAEREKTLVAINGLLDELQGKTDGLIRAYEESNKKTASR
jgi:hypothetical protein